MVRGQPLSNNLYKVILHIAKYLDVALIQHYSGCATHSIQQVVADYRQTRAMIRAHLEYDHWGRKRIMKAGDVHVSYQPEINPIC